MVFAMRVCSSFELGLGIEEVLSEHFFGFTEAPDWSTNSIGVCGESLCGYFLHSLVRIVLN